MFSFHKSPAHMKMNPDTLATVPYRTSAMYYLPSIMLMYLAVQITTLGLTRQNGVFIVKQSPVINSITCQSEKHLAK